MLQGLAYDYRQSLWRGGDGGKGFMLGGKEGMVGE
jgi:hypothetical protein